MKQIHLNFRWLEIYVRVGLRKDSARVEFQWYRVASRQRMPQMRAELAQRLAVSFKNLAGRT